MSTTLANAGPVDLVAELEAQFGDKLTKARTDFQENQSERQKLDVKRGKLAAQKSNLEAKRKECLIAHGKGEKGAVDKRAKAEADLKAVNEEIEAVDEAVAYESERTGTLQIQLQDMETKLADAKKRQIQNGHFNALIAKKEEFIEFFTQSCVSLGELVNIANDLIFVEGHALYEQATEDIVLRTARLLLIQDHKYTEVYSGLALARREFPVTALVPPPESD